MKLIFKKLISFACLLATLLLSQTSYITSFELTNSEHNLALKESNLLSEALSAEKKKKKHKNKASASAFAKERTSEKANSKTNTEATTQATATSTLSVKQDKIPDKTLNQTMTIALNRTYAKQNLKDFKRDFNTFDYKMFDKQLQEIFNTMKIYDEKYKTMHGDRVYIELFVNDFTKCDKDKSNDLNMDEFKACMESDPYLKLITVPTERWASRKNMTNKDLFYKEIFDVMDGHNSTAINFHGYMELRLVIFSWRRCGIQGPFIEEVNWECAIETITDMKTSTRTTLRNIFYMAHEMTGADNLRNLDFITFLYFAQGMMSYSRINGKMDSDITKNEFNLALDENALPKRYNQFLVDTFFKLTQDSNNLNGGIDLRTFIYYDFIFRLFGKQSKTRPYYLNFQEFAAVINDEIFPTKVRQELSLISDKSFSRDSYNMFTYMNISSFHDERDFFTKFVEKSSTRKARNLNANKKVAALSKHTSSLDSNVIQNHIMELPSPGGLPANMTAVLLKIFNLIDVNSDGFIDYYDFGNFYQTAFLFSKFDVKEMGQILIGDAYEKYHYWAEFPRVSETYRERANRFNLVFQDSYVDLFLVTLIMRIDDLVALYTRKNDATTLYEYELKRIFMKCSLNFVLDSRLNNCVKGVDRRNIPKYDWECAFMTGLQQNIDYVESASAYNTVKAQNITLVNTVFNNVDPALANPPKPTSTGSSAAARKFFFF